MNTSSDKKQYERAVKKSVSMPEMLFDQANGKRRACQISTFSDYIQGLIRRDLGLVPQKEAA